MGWVNSFQQKLKSRIPRWVYSTPATLFYIYFLTLAVYLVNGRSIAFVDTGPARHLALSLIRDHDLDLNEVRPFLDVLELGYTTKEVDGDRVSYYPVGTAFLAAPFYAVGLLFGLEADQLDGLAKLEKWAAANLGAILAVLFWVLLKRRTAAGPAIRIFVLLAFAFGSPNWVLNSQGLWQHIPLQIFIVLALLMLPQSLAVRGATWRLAWCGVLLGLAGFMRPTGFILIPVWGLYLFFKSFPKAMAFGAGAVVGALPQILYNFTYIRDEKSGYFNLIFKGGYFEDLRIIDNLLALLFSPSRGLFIFCPFLLLLAPWLIRKMRRPQFVLAVPPLLLTMSASAIFCIYLVFQIWWAGWCYGPRFMSDIMPFLCLLLVPPLRFLCTRRPAFAIPTVALAAITLIWAIGLQVVGAFRYDGGWDGKVVIAHYPDAAWHMRDNAIAYCWTGAVDPYKYVQPPGYYTVPPGVIHEMDKQLAFQWLYAGFYEQEWWGVWSQGVMPATLLLHLEQGPGRLYINAMGTGSNYDPARYDVYLNGHHIDEELIHPNAFIDWKSETLSIPLKEKYLTGGIEHLRIISRDPRRAAPTGRTYGIGLKTMLYVPEAMEDEATSTVEHMKTLNG